MAKLKSTSKPKKARAKHPAKQISQTAKGKQRAKYGGSGSIRKKAGYNLFVRAFHCKIKQDLAKANMIATPPATVWSRYIGDAWNNAPEQIKAYFNELAKAETLEDMERAQRDAAAEEVEEVEEVEDDEAWEVESEEGVDAEDPDPPLTIKLPATARIVEAKDSEGVEAGVDDAWSERASSRLSTPPDSPVPADHPVPGPSTSHTYTVIRPHPTFVWDDLEDSTAPQYSSRRGSGEVPVHSSLWSPSLSFAQSPQDTRKWPRP